MRKLLSVFLAIAMLIMTCFVLNVTAVASEDDSKITTVPIALPAELQALENQANEKYNKLLQVWAYAPELIDDANANFPSFYGGAYINAEKKLVIQVTSLDESVIEYFENIIGLTNVIFDEVKYSYAELKQAHADIVNKMDATSTDPIIANIAGVGISYKDNAVALYLITSDSDAKSSSIKNEVQEKVSTFDSIKIIATSAKDTPTAVVEPGTTIKNGAYSRSVGFWAEDEDGNLGIVTAPHSSISEGDTISIGTRTFGVAATPYFSGSVDAVFIEKQTHISQQQDMFRDGISVWCQMHIRPLLLAPQRTLRANLQAVRLAKLSIQTIQHLMGLAIASLPAHRALQVIVAALWLGAGHRRAAMLQE